MVTPLSVGRAFAVRGRLEAFLGRSVGPQLRPLSQRDIARLTGFPRSTLGDFLRGEGAPRPRTVERIEQLLTDPRLQVQRPGMRTVRVDAPAWSRQSLAALEQPEGARGFAFIYTVGDHETGYGQTKLSARSDGPPQAAIGLVPDGADSIVSVLWYTG